MRTSAFSCSIRRFVSLIAVSARSFEQPKPTIWSGCPPTAPPVMPADGLLLFFGVAPAYWTKAAMAPPMSASYWLPNAPWQSDRIPILIVDACERPVAVVATTAATIAAAVRTPTPAGSQNRRPRLLT